MVQIPRASPDLQITSFNFDVKCLRLRQQGKNTHSILLSPKVPLKLHWDELVRAEREKRSWQQNMEASRIWCHRPKMMNTQLSVGMLRASPEAKELAALGSCPATGTGVGGSAGNMGLWVSGVSPSATPPRQKWLPQLCQVYFLEKLSLWPKGQQALLQARAPHWKHGSHRQRWVLNTEPPPSASLRPQTGAHTEHCQTDLYGPAAGQKLEVSVESYHLMSKDKDFDGCPSNNVSR